MKYIRSSIFLLLTLGVVSAYAQIPTVLTDKIRKGDGIIDIFKDVGSASLQDHLQGGTLMLGVDLNEDASGVESSTSAGVAIKQLELLIQTSNGDFTFSDFYTNTTALIQETGTTAAQQFYTLFGTGGSNQLTGSTSNFDISTFDDVIQINDINFTGTITGAQLRVTFLDTADSGANESFFDYSAGYEELAILTSADATLLESADIGLGSDTPQSVTYDLSAPSGTPEPEWYLLLIIPVIVLWRKYRSAKART